MSEPNDNGEPARQSETTKTVEKCIHLLADWFSEEGEKVLSNATAKTRLQIPDEQYVQVMSSLSDQGIVEEVTPVLGDRFQRFKIRPGVVPRWDAIKSRDRVSKVIGWLRSSPFAAGPILLLLVLITLSTAVNEGYDFLTHVGLIHEQPAVTLTPVVLPCPAPSPSPDIEVAKYDDQPLEFWVTKLHDRDTKVAAPASNALGSFGKSAVRPLVKALYSDNEDTVRFAATTLGGLGPIASEAIPNLEKTKQTHTSLGTVIEDALKKIRPK